MITRRASRLRDHAGQWALPGGRVDPGDAGGRAAAERETLEEVGISLAGSERLGRLDDKQGNPLTAPKLVISALICFAMICCIVSRSGKRM